MADQEQMPIRITDKRKEKAEAARAKAEAAGHPVVGETVLTVNRLERIHELIAKNNEAGALTDDEKAELLRLQAEEEAAAEEERAQDANTIQARTAFYVILMHDGTVKAEPDCNAMLELDHLANIDEMYQGAAVVTRDIEAAVAARHTVFQLQQQAAAGMARRVAAPPSGIVPPGRR